MRKCLALCMSALCLVSCGSDQESSQTLFHDDGRVKPKVSLVNVYDSSQSDLSWSLSEEFTTSIESRFFQHKKLFISRDFNSLTDPSILQTSSNPFMGEVEWVKELRSNTEFVVFMELLEHNYHPNDKENGFFNNPNNRAFELNLAMRIKVVDMRGDRPLVILSEVIRQTNSIPWQFASIDYDSTVWGKTTFSLSPMGLAHSSFAKKIAAQIEDYILLAKTH